jgi:glycosyltransferase involved in cell wall biosynthesis
MPKVLFFVTEDWFFVSHFLAMAGAARAQGLDLVVATRVRDHRAQLETNGIRVHALNVERKSLGLLTGIRNLMSAIRIVRAERPDVVHCIALRPVVMGGIATKLGARCPLILAPTGLGLLWVERGWGAGLLRGLVRAIVGSWLRGPNTRYLFENRDDPREFGLDPDGPEVTIVGGAGADAAEFPMAPEPPAPPLKVAVVARMIAPKGIAEAVEAVRRARAAGAPIELHLFGGLDPSSRRAISADLLHRWSSEPGISWHGPTADVPRVWREHHVALFLSYYREGVPRTLIEAAASGRAIVTTDMPGCRDVVRDQVSGILVPPHDVEAAARALVLLATDPALRARMGAAANKHFHEHFTVTSVQSAVGRLYRSLVDASHLPGDSKNVTGSCSTLVDRTSALEARILRSIQWLSRRMTNLAGN